jgi:hypothetical protein
MYSFNYIKKQDFGYPTEISMTVPERSIDEMCEYFQRFLLACGYIFDEGERIQSVKKKGEDSYLGCAGDILTFNDNGSAYCYDFGDNSPVFFGSGLKGGMGEDHFSFAGYGVKGACGKDIISFS